MLIAPCYHNLMFIMDSVYLAQCLSYIFIIIIAVLHCNGAKLISQLSQLKVFLHIMLIAMLSQVCVIIETAE